LTSCKKRKALFVDKNTEPRNGKIRLKFIPYTVSLRAVLSICHKALRGKRCTLGRHRRKIDRWGTEKEDIEARLTVRDGGSTERATGGQIEWGGGNETLRKWEWATIPSIYRKAQPGRGGHETRRRYL